MPNKLVGDEIMYIKEENIEDTINSLNMQRFYVRESRKTCKRDEHEYEHWTCNQVGKKDNPNIKGLIIHELCKHRGCSASKTSTYWQEEMELEV